MTGLLPYRIARVPSAWADVRTRAIMTTGAALVGTVVALFAFGILKPADDLPEWMKPAAAFALVLAGGLAIDLAGRVARAWRGVEPVVTADGPVWLSGKVRRVHVHHPAVRDLRSVDVRLRAAVIVAEEFHESSGERGTRIHGESRHDALLASLDEAGLADPAVDIVVDAAIPAAAADAGWSWSLVVVCETQGHHQHQYEYPFPVADGGEPTVVTRG
jgi:hypothetical protein